MERTTSPVLTDNIPLELRTLKQWVLWRYETREEKLTKVPYQANGRKAESDNPATWTSFDKTLAALPKFDGLGVMFANGLAGIDLDHHIEGGKVSDFARSVVEKVNSYTELSPSGTGLHILFFGCLPEGRRRKDELGIEMYSSGRFFTITGRRLDGAPAHVSERSPELAALHTEVFGKAKPPAPSKPAQPNTLDDQALINKACAAHNGDKFSSLYNGNWKTYFTSQSEADLALCSILAFWTGGDAGRTDRLFRSSGLMREKWDERHNGNGATYGQLTLDRGLAQSNYYTPRIEREAPEPYYPPMDDVIDQLQPPGEEIIEPSNSNAHAPQQPGKAEKKQAPTHPELADRWINQAPPTVYGMQEWRRYKDGVYPAVDEDIIKQEIAGIVTEAQAEGMKPTASVISSVAEIARLRVLVGKNEWDSDPDLLPCKNGILHLPTMTLRPHSPDNHFTFRVAYDYDPTAAAKTWDYFLTSTLDAETVQFLQEFSGYCLTTDTRYETAVWLYGKRGSGKSTFIEGLRAMLGERAGILGLSRIEQSRFALGAVAGKTLLTATEQPAVFIQQSDVLNALISGEPIQIEKKFKDEMIITPVAKLVWAMNEFPRVPDSGNGLFRRVKVIEFPNRPEEQRDESVKEKIKTEGSGILNWALAGLAHLRSLGKFSVPAKVKQASDEFERTNNIPALFVEDKCITGPDYKAQSNTLFQAYKTWCADNNHKAQSSTSIAQDWRNLGFDKYEANGRKYWKGVGLKDE
jgi:putative DNA primase/helicase